MFSDNFAPKCKKRTRVYADYFLTSEPLAGITCLEGLFIYRYKLIDVGLIDIGITLFCVCHALTQENNGVNKVRFSVMNNWNS